MPAARRLLTLLCVVLAAALAACGETGDTSGGSDQGEPSASEGFAAIPGVVRDVGPAVVAVQVRSPVGSGEGSGVVWDQQGIVVTNHHVVEGARDVTVVLAGGDRVPAQVRASDPRTDLAVLDVEREGLPTAEFSDRLPVAGELAIAIGNPLGFEDTVTAGIVSGLDRALPTGGRTPALVGLIQTDASISPGNSGGALVNGSGEVMGINVAYIPPQARAVAIGFAIPAPLVRDVVTDLLEDGEVEHAFLGVNLTQVSPDAAEQLGVEGGGVAVLRVAAGSPAEAAGLRAGDTIVAIDGDDVRQVEDVYGALRRRAPGDRIELTVVRDGDERVVEVELGDRPPVG